MAEESLQQRDYLTAKEEGESLAPVTRKHLASLPPNYSVTPSNIQAALGCGWNAACSSLEALERAGEIVRDRQPGRANLWWKAAARTAVQEVVPRG